MSVSIISNIEDFVSFISDGVSVVDFTATWCGPCQYMKPIFHSFAKVYPHVNFQQVDVDENQDISSKCRIQAMPTFQVFLNGSKIDELVGADEEELNELIQKYAP